MQRQHIPLPLGDRQPRLPRHLVQAVLHRPQQVEQVQLRIVQQRHRLARPGKPEQPLEPRPVFRPHRVEWPRRLSLRRLHRADTLPLRPLPEAESRVKIQHRIVGEQVYVLGQPRKYIPLRISRETNYSKDKNLWHLSHEGLDLEDPANEPTYNKPGFLEMGVSPEMAPDKPTYITLHFEKGVPTKLDGVEMGGVELIEKLNALGGANGIGLLDIVENRLVGMKCRGVY